MSRTLLGMGKKSKAPTATVRLSADLQRRIAVIAAHRDLSVPDYLAEVLGPVIKKHHELMLLELNRERDRRVPAE